MVARADVLRAGLMHGKIVEQVNRLLGQVALPLANGAISLLICYQVVARYVFNNPPSWSEELARITMIWMVYLGLAVALERGQEIVLRGTLHFAGKTAARWLAVLRDELVVVFLATLLYQSVRLVYFDRLMTTAALELPWSWVYLAVPVGVALYGLASVPVLLARLAREKWIAAVELVLLAAAFLAVTRLGVSEVWGVHVAWLTPVLMVALMLMEMPIALTLGVSCFYYLVVTGGIPLLVMPRSFTHGIDSFTIMALPLFILAAEFMNHGGITERIVNLAMNLVGHIRGGLAHVAVAANMIMAGISGSALADTAATGSILIPAMEKQGIARPFASAVIVAAGTIGPMIPPSIFFIIYGGLANVSILKLFLGGFVPGVLMGLFFMGVVYVKARQRGYPVQPRPPLRAVARSLWAGLPALLLPVMVIGGMVGGVFTATEAGAIAVFFALGQGLLARRLSLRAIWDALGRTAVTVSATLIVLSMANLVSYIANRAQVPHTITALLLGVSSTPWVVLLVVNLFLLLLGAFEAVIPTMIVATPILVPALVKIGVDPVHFGVVMTLTLMIALISPPHGASLFLVSNIAKVNMRELIVEVFPFTVALLILLGLITYIPQIVMFLPNALSRS